jgi:hypothetical protein
MGTPSDTRLRVVKKRVDNTRRINMIKKARVFIYGLGHAIQSEGVEDLLQCESYVPTLVCPVILVLAETFVSLIVA